MSSMVSYPRRLQSGHFTCYLNRTYHVLTTAFSIAVDFPSFREHNPLESPLQRGRSRFGSVIMYCPPPLRGRPGLAGQKGLLIDRCQATCQVRASVLRSHGVEVHAAEEISSARFLWQPNIYN